MNSIREVQQLNKRELEHAVYVPASYIYPILFLSLCVSPFQIDS